MANVPTLNDQQLQQLLDRQFQKAMDGDSLMLQHLGKSYLNQTEKHHHTLEALPFTQLTIDEIEARLAQRAAEAEEEKLIQGTAVAFLNPPSSSPSAQDDRLPETTEGEEITTSKTHSSPRKKGRKKKASE